MGFLDRLRTQLAAGTGTEELGAVDTIERALRIARGEEFEPAAGIFGPDPRPVLPPTEDVTRGALQGLVFAPPGIREISPQRATEPFITPSNPDPDLIDMLQEGFGGSGVFVGATGLAGGAQRALFNQALTVPERIAATAFLGAGEGALPTEGTIEPLRIAGAATIGAALPLAGAGLSKFLSRLRASPDIPTPQPQQRLPLNQDQIDDSLVRARARVEGGENIDLEAAIQDEIGKELAALKTQTPRPVPEPTVVGPASDEPLALLPARFDEATTEVAGINKLQAAGEVDAAPGTTLRLKDLGPEFASIQRGVTGDRPFTRLRGDPQFQADTVARKAMRAAGMNPTAQNEALARLSPQARMDLARRYEEGAADAAKALIRASRPEGSRTLRDVVDDPKLRDLQNRLMKEDVSRSGVTGEEGFFQIGRQVEHIPLSRRRKLGQWMRQVGSKRYNDGLSWYYNMLLLSPGRIRDIMSNTFELAESISTRTIRRGLTNPTQVFRQFAGFGDGVLEAVRSSGEAFRTGLVRELREGFQGGTDIDLPARLQGTPNLSRRVIAAIDDFYTVLGYNMDAMDRIYQRAIQKVGTKNKAALTAEVKRLRDNIPQDIADDSLRTARRITFRDIPSTELEANALKIIRGIQDFPVVGPVFLPFGPTLLRLGKRSVEYTPLNYINALAQVVTGSGTPETAANAAIRGTYGTLALGSLAYLAWNGLISGEARHLSPQQKAALRASGWQPQSIKIGDNWFSYRNLGPISFGLRYAADTIEDIKAGEDMSASLARNFSESVLDTTFLPGFGDIIDAVVDPDAYDNKQDIQGLFEKIQPSTGLAALARAIDPVVRERPESFEDALVQRLPGGQALAERGFEDLSPQQARLGLFGEIIRRDGSIAEVFLSPIRRSQITQDPTLLEVARLVPTMDALGKTLTPPSLPSNLQLTDSEDFLARRTMGKMQKEAVREIIQLPEYAQLGDDQKLDLLFKAHQRARSTVRNRVKALKNQNLTVTENSLRTGSVGLR